MTRTTRRLAVAVLVMCVVAVWGASTDEDVARAQGRKPVVITRIYTGPDGLAHAEDIELKLNARGISDMLKATGAEFSVRAPTPGANPNNTAASAANGTPVRRVSSSSRWPGAPKWRWPAASTSAPAPGTST